MLRRIALLAGLGLATDLTTLTAQDACVFPTRSGPIRVRQPDGSELVLTMRGKGPALWYQDERGHAILHGGSGYVYARPTGSGHLVPTPHRAGEVEPSLHRIEPLAESHGPVVAPGHPAPLDRAGRVQGSAVWANQPPQLPAESIGTAANLVIALRFAGHGPGGQNRTLPSASAWDMVFNAVGGDPVLAPAGSVRDFYLENSYGLLTIDSTVVAWVDVPGTEAYYCDGSSGLGTAKMRELIKDALAAADPLVNFAHFDLNGDGWIDAITFLHSGYGAEFGGVDQYGAGTTDRIWSHRSAIPVWTSAEGILVSDYSISPGLWDISGSQAGRIGVICHELGHFFGIPDLYDTDGGGAGVGWWGLMGAGSWAFDGNQHVPTQMCAWSKMHLGWIAPQSYFPAYPAFDTLPNVEQNPVVLKMQTGYPPGEYLLIEYRDAIGFDALIPQPGLAIWHIDETKGSLGSNDMNADEGWFGQLGWPGNNQHYRVALLSPDAAFDLELNNNRGDGNDIYQELYIGQITDSSIPSTESYRGGVQSANYNRLQDIGTAGADKTFRFWNDENPVITPGTLPALVANVPYSVQLSSTGGAPPFTWSEELLNPGYAENDLGSSSFSATGVAQGWNADDAVWELSLPFAFPFYERTHAKVYVSSNGFLDFAPVESEPGNSTSGLRYGIRIAPLWLNLRTDVLAGDDVYLDTSVGGEVKVRWQGQTFQTGAKVNFSVTLHDDGTIRFDYGSGDAGLPATVGISAGRDAIFSPALHDTRTDLGGAASLRFDLSGSLIPPGLTLSSAGVLAGLPQVSTVGTFQPVFRKEDSEYRFDITELPLPVEEPPDGVTTDAYPQLVEPGDTLTIRHYGAEPLALGLFTLAEINGNPAFLDFGVGRFDRYGVWNLTVPVIPYKPSLAGTRLGFAVFELSSTGLALSDSADVTLR